MSFSLAKIFDVNFDDKLSDFEKIYDAHHTKIRDLMFKLAQPRDLDKLTQLAFLNIWKKLNFFRRHSISKAWLYRCAINTAHEYLNKSFSSSETASFTSIQDNSAHSKIGDQALASLDFNQRCVVILHVFHDLKIKDVAYILEIDEPTVQNRLESAKAKMKSFLAEKAIVLKD